MEKFKNFLTILITILICLLWLLPSIEAHYFPLTSPIGLLYLLIFTLTVLWGIVLYNYYYIEK